MHWDHAQGALLFPSANVWVQADEYIYYTGAAWQDGGNNGGIDKRDVAGFVQLNLDGRLKFVTGDDKEVLPGIRAYTGGKHTFQSQYIRVEGEKPVVLASDNAYLFQNIETQTPINKNATFSIDSNRAAIERMIQLAGSVERVLPGHDPLIFERYPSEDGVATIRE
jgi:glyoxylase-like metal-dependent hydrolase (beta-lactamase superfamily II)